MEIRVIFSIIPATFALFAVALALVAALNRQLVAARWGSLAFALATVGVVLDSLRTPGSSWGLFYIHVAVIAAFAQALSVRHRRRLPLAVLSALAGTALLTSVLNLAHFSLETRQLAFNLGVAGSLALFVFLAREWGHRRATDKAVLATLGLLGISYLLRITYLLERPLADSLSHQPNFFAIGPNLLFHFIMGLSGAAAGLLLLGVLAADLMRLQAGRYMIDPLTGVGNRHALDAAIEAEAEGEWDCCGAIVLDLDHFKHVNDRYGHGGGDRLLSAVGSALSNVVGFSGQMFRTGGEEFIILTQGRHCARLAEIGELAREAIAALQVRRRGTTIRATASIGWCFRRQGESIDQLLECADRAMYAAKAGGRNQVCGFDRAAMGTPELTLVAS